MHPHRLQQLVTSVPDTIDADQRARLLAHVQASDRCRVRVERVNAELARVLDGVGSSDRAVDLACELDGLERVQQRMDRRLTALVEELTSTPRAVPYDDGVPA
jgi:anti-sigma factor ChrR (cupin superfamily)